MVKLQIKSEKPLLLEDFFFGSWSKSADTDTDTDSPKFRNPTIDGKRVKEKVYIYTYKYKNILLTFLYFSVPFTGGKKRGAENRTVSVSVSEASH